MNNMKKKKKKNKKMTEKVYLENLPIVEWPNTKRLRHVQRDRGQGHDKGQQSRQCVGSR